MNGYALFILFHILQSISSQNLIKKLLISHFFVFIVYSLNYINNFEYSNLELTSNKKCDLSLPMTGALLEMNKEESLSCNIFIWDAPPFNKTKELFDQSKNSGINSKTWMQAIIHLHPKKFK